MRMLIYKRAWIIYDANKLTWQFVDNRSMPPYEVLAPPTLFNEKKKKKIYSIFMKIFVIFFNIRLNAV